MEFVAAHCGASDESSCGDSSGPTTPVYSPLIHPFVIKSGAQTPVEQLFDLDKQARILPGLPTPAESVASDDEVSNFSVKNVCFIGAGYVGGPTAAVVALHNPGVRVEVVDKDQKRIQRWRSRHLPIHEPGLTDVVRVCRDGARAKWEAESDKDQVVEAESWERQPNLFFSTDVSGSIARSDIIFLAVNTSTKTFGIGSGRATDMSACDAATREIAAHARPGTIIVEKSTVPCGTARRIASTLNSLRPGVPFEILSNPEFLAEGTAIPDLLNPDRVIIGSLPTESGRVASDVLASLYSPWIPHDRILSSNVWSSELSKLVANAMLAQRISSINSISAICEETGADIAEIARAVGHDSRIGSKFLKAGLGFGGSCFRKDICSLVYLAESLGLDEVAEYWSQVNRMNQFQHRRFAKKVINRLGQNLIGRKIAILGFAFKANTGDPRESLAAEVIKDLLVEKPAEIAIYDPYCKEADILRELRHSILDNKTTTITVCETPYQACLAADAVLIATDCDQFKSKKQLLFRTPNQGHPPVVHGIDVHHHSKKMHYDFAQEPVCTEECNGCQQSEQQSSQNAYDDIKPLNWSRIVHDLKTPRWIFDGRDVLDNDEINRLGVEVNIESIGKKRNHELHH